MGEVSKVIGSVAGGSVAAIDSAIGTAAEGISKLTANVVSGISDVPSVLENSRQTFETKLGNVTDLIGGTIGDVAAMPDPLDFFQETAHGITGLVGELLPGSLTDIGKTLTDPGLDYGGAIAGFADNVFGGGLVDSIENIITEIPLARLPLQLLTDTFERNILAMTSIFDDLFKQDPVAPDYHSQIFTVRVKLGRLELSDTVISRVLTRMHELTERITQTSLTDTKKEALDKIEDERRRRFKERFDS